MSAPSPIDFTDEANRYAVETYARGWTPYIAWPTLARARQTASALITGGFIVRIIDLTTGRIVPLTD